MKNAKRVKVKGARKPTRKTLKRNLDTIVSLLVRKRDKKCVVCGNRDNAQAGHLFSRSSLSTRWDLTNVHQQCGGCNLIHTWDTIPYHDWFKKKYGEEAFRTLYKEYKSIKKWTDKQLKELYEELRKELEFLD